MSQVSMNPRASALSPHTLSILQPLLRRIALKQRDAAGGADEHLGSGVEFPDLEIQNDHVTARLDATALSEQQRADSFYQSNPAAASLTEAEMATELAEGHDPWSDEAGTFQNGRLKRPPIRQLTIAARFLSSFPSAEFVDEMLAPRTCTHMILAGSDRLSIVANAIEEVAKFLAETTGLVGANWYDLEVVFDTVREDTERTFSKDRYDRFDARIRSHVRDGTTFLFVSSQSVSLPESAEAICDRKLHLPPLSHAHIIEILRVTHTKTGQLAEQAVKDLLPPERDLGALPVVLVENAFLETTTLKVAIALSKAVEKLRKSSGKTLNDIVLNEPVIAHVKRMVADVETWHSGGVPWEDVASSILLYGPPGNGKTLLATSLSGSLRCPLIATSYSDCQKHGHQGDMLKALSGKVEEAIRKAPSVFFLDELDSFTRRNNPGRSSDYVVGVVNGLLEHLSRLNEEPGVVVLAATNFPHLVDPAVIRPGRFDLHLEIGNPDRQSIIRILEHALEGDAASIDLSTIADQLLGTSGAQVVAVVREAKGLARIEAAGLSQSHLSTAADRVCPPLDQALLWRAAVHEAGHLVAAHLLNLPAPVSAIIGAAGGAVDIPASRLENRKTAENRTAALLAGRAAEIVIFGSATNGAGLGQNSDLSIATELAEKVFLRMGTG